MKTANELQVTDQEYEALLWVRDQLATGKIVRLEQAVKAVAASKMFRMSTILSRNEGFSECKTVACIGGWMAVHMGYVDRWDAVNYVNNEMSRALGPLCFPEPGLMVYIEPEHAVQAIDSFLETGEPMWMQVMGNALVQRVTHSHVDEFAGDRLQSNRVMDLGSQQRRLAHARQQTRKDMRPEQVRIPSKVSEQG